MTEATSYNHTIFWHRRDLRFEDNAGLYQALKNSKKVHPVFIFDSSILDLLPKSDQRVHYIHQSIEALKLNYQKMGSDLTVYYGNPRTVIPELAQTLNIEAVFTNRDYEPIAIDRDKEIYNQLNLSGIHFKGFKDQVIFEKSEIVKNDDSPYLVFTPYSKKWKEKLNSFYLKPYPNHKYAHHLIKSKPTELISISELGFDPEQKVTFPASTINESIINKYNDLRDFPALDTTSRQSVHLRFGTISIRSLAAKAQRLNETFLNELIWRDFYQMLLFQYPHSSKSSFKKEYDKILWRNDEHEFELWCKGKTGYPLVDAGMRELNDTGFMHNRVRMVVASFLTKHLLIDWQWGATYFAEKLLDFELASNIGGWQWAAGTGCDAAPYFRVFNPSIQQEKFDPELKYVRKWVPEFGTDLYPEQMVEHKMARLRAISHYQFYLK
ncbi:MAG: DNA photolyase family protein [Bacteroidetes bacterium]|nr:DNA photolyase family protein [Bacteroidota bacterium]